MHHLHHWLRARSIQALYFSWLRRTHKVLCICPTSSCRLYLNCWSLHRRPHRVAPTCTWPSRTRRKRSSSLLPRGCFAGRGSRRRRGRWGKWKICRTGRWAWRLLIRFYMFKLVSSGRSAECLLVGFPWWRFSRSWIALRFRYTPREHKVTHPEYGRSYPATR